MSASAICPASSAPTSRASNWEATSEEGMKCPAPLAPLTSTR
eukprot:CAMPEP_0182876380 /NCGR_PEP_ID=MMETSP0034_2-20130328/14115_1 /TAXON_ID=156128 /ORGANISM="Nephroselmis pyriformis, Strain CCMP717" /LENGTH=41 /DNA_ID= /DNA_START= /DNA_END= /DNA_ORIENTATION=